MFTRVSRIALAGTSFLVPVLVDITYVTLLVAFALAVHDIPVEAWLALTGRAAARADVRVEVLVGGAAIHSWAAVAHSRCGVVHVANVTCVRGAVERGSHACAFTRVPEVLSGGVVSVAEFNIKWVTIFFAVEAVILSSADASALVVLPDHVDRAVARV